MFPLGTGAEITSVIAADDRMRADLHLRQPDVVPPGLADRAHRGLAPFAVHAVDEQHAVEMVGLVLQAARQVTCADHLDRIPAGREALGDRLTRLRSPWWPGCSRCWNPAPGRRRVPGERPHSVRSA